MSADDLTTVLVHQERPFLHPEYAWKLGDERYRVSVDSPISDETNRATTVKEEEESGQTWLATVANTMIYFRNRRLLYYGTADRYVGVAETSGSHTPQKAHK